MKESTDITNKLRANLIASGRYLTTIFYNAEEYAARDRKKEESALIYHADGGAEFMRINKEGELIFNREDFDITPKEMAALFADLNTLECTRTGGSFVTGHIDDEVVYTYDMKTGVKDFPKANTFDPYTHWFIEALNNL